MSVTVATRDNLAGGGSSSLGGSRKHRGSGGSGSGSGSRSVNLRNAETTASLISSVTPSTPNNSNDPVAASLRNARRSEKIFKKIKDIEFSTIEISKSSQQQQSIPPLPPLTLNNNNNSNTSANNHHHQPEVGIMNGQSTMANANGSNGASTKIPTSNPVKSILKTQSTDPSSSSSGTAAGNNPPKKISISFGANTISPTDGVHTSSASNLNSSTAVVSHHDMPPRIPEEKAVASTLPLINVTNSGGAESSVSNYHPASSYKPPGSSVPSQRMSSIPVSIKSYNSLNTTTTNNNNGGASSTNPSSVNSSNNTSNGSTANNEVTHFVKQTSSLLNNNNNKLMTNSRSMIGNNDTKPNGSGGGHSLNTTSNLLTPIESANINPAQDRSPKTSLSNMSKSSFSSQQTSGKNNGPYHSPASNATTATNTTMNNIFDIEMSLSRKDSATSNSIFLSNANSSNRTNSTVSIRDHHSTATATTTTTTAKSNTFLRKNSNNNHLGLLGASSNTAGQSHNSHASAAFVEQFNDSKPVFSKSLANKIANAKKLKTKSLPPSLDSLTTTTSNYGGGGGGGGGHSTTTFSNNSHLTSKRYNHNSRMNGGQHTQNTFISNAQQSHSDSSTTSTTASKQPPSSSSKHPSLSNAAATEKSSNAGSEDLNQTSKYTLLIQNKYKNNRKA